MHSSVNSRLATAFEPLREAYNREVDVWVLQEAVRAVNVHAQDRKRAPRNRGALEVHPHFAAELARVLRPTISRVRFMRAAQPEIDELPALRGQDTSRSLAGDQGLKVNDIEDSTLDELRLENWCRDPQDRLIRVADGAFWGEEIRAIAKRCVVRPGRRRWQFSS